MAGFIAPSLPTFSDDLYGYIQAVNYLVRQFAPDVAFGWQTNVWATGTADWVLRDTADPVAEGQAIAGFIHELGVYSGEYAPDFIAFDKFERDCFSPDALAHYGWNATCWLNYGDGQTGDESAADARHAVANPWRPYAYSRRGRQ